MEHFYDGQVRRYITQFMRLMSNFSYKDSSGKLTQVPVRYGDVGRQVSAVMKQNSENLVNSAPFIACYIKNFEYARERIQNPTHISKINIRERAVSDDGTEYLNYQGTNATIERMMPSPFNITFSVDIWTTNTDQKLQILEQILVLFNPAMEIQTSVNFVDWTSISYVELTGVTWSNRNIPQGAENDIDIASLSFLTPIWLTTPAKVKQLGIITQIITNIFQQPSGMELDPDMLLINPVTVRAITPGNYSVLILGTTAQLMYEGENLVGDDYVHLPVKNGPDINWYTLLDLYPGQFKAGLSKIMLTRPDGTQIVGTMALNPSNDVEMMINFDQDTLLNTPLPDLTDTFIRGTINAVINPTTFNPGNPDIDTRYLILENIPPDVQAWKNSDGTQFLANANDIIQWDGVKWNIIFDSTTTQPVTFITNLYTGIQYKWDGSSWSKSYEGIYAAGAWQISL